MKHSALRRFAGIAAALALGVASAPRAQAAQTAPAGSRQISQISHAATAAPATALAGTPTAQETGAGFGAMIGCTACVLGAGLVIAGGPGAIIAAVNMPGSAIAVLACAATCYEAFQ